MAESRSDRIKKIEAQRRTIREHIEKYKKFKKNGEYTSTAETTIKNCQAIIERLRDSSIESSYEDSWIPD